MKEKKSVGYIMGQIVGTILTGCILAILIAVTAKIIFWII